MLLAVWFMMSSGNLGTRSAMDGWIGEVAASTLASTGSVV